MPQQLLNIWWRFSSMITFPLRYLVTSWRERFWLYCLGSAQVWCPPGLDAIVKLSDDCFPVSPLYSLFHMPLVRWLITPASHTPPFTMGNKKKVIERERLPHKLNEWTPILIPQFNLLLSMSETGLWDAMFHRGKKSLGQLGLHDEGRGSHCAGETNIYVYSALLIFFPPKFNFCTLSMLSIWILF